MPGEVTNLQNRLRQLNPEAAARADELIAGGMEPTAAYAQAAQEYGVSPDVPAVSADFDTPIQPPTDELDITMPTFGEEVDDSLAVEPDLPSPDLVTTPVGGPPAGPAQPAGNGRSAIMQALSAMGQRPAVEAPVVQPPDSRLRILQALSKAGSGLLGLRDQSRTEKRNRASQATANVINALSKGRAGARGLEEEARPGLLTRLAAVPGQVAGAGLEIQTDRQAAEQQTFENQLASEKAAGLNAKELMNILHRERTADRLERIEQAQIEAQQRAQEKAKLEETGGALGITTQERNELTPQGRVIWERTRDPFGQLSESEARKAVLEFYGEEYAETALPGAVAVLIDGFNKSRDAANKDLNDLVEGISKTDYRTPEATMSVLDARISGLNMFIPERKAKEITRAMQLVADAPKLGAAERSRFARIASVRTGLANVLTTIRTAPDMFSFTEARANALKGSFTKRILPDDVIQTMTQLGFAREILLRAFTGAAAPETEYQRFKDAFIGSITDGPRALKTQLETLDEALYNEQTSILQAAAPVPKPDPLAKDEVEEEDSAYEAAKQKIIDIFAPEE